MRVFILSLIMAIMMPCSQAFAENISKLIIRIEIDVVKQSNKNWDTINAFGKEPDPTGEIVVFSDKGTIRKKIHVQNTYNVEEVFENIDLSPGDRIAINLDDRDRGRVDDTICKGDIRWNGEPQMEVRHGLATVKLYFII